MNVQRYDMRVDIRNYGLSVELEIEESDTGDWVKSEDVTALEAEVARLREAMTLIGTNDYRDLIDHDACVSSYDKGYRAAQDRCAQIARTALAPAAQKDGDRG